ncbi:MAG: DUF1698 domain-containing protein [Okeania sp. SIO3C4]|nr:DUF1698 domain-containing protein [Okeania sp. SIO3C4]
MSSINSVNHRQRLIESANKLKWFHAVDFGDYQTRGRFKPTQAHNLTELGVMELLSKVDLRNADCLDVGTVDGLIALGMKMAGARTVTATDSSMVKSRFEIARSILELDVEIMRGVQIKDFKSVFSGKLFDMIVCAGVIYHMLNPMSAFIECRKLLKTGGLFIMESACIFDREPKLVLNTEEVLVPQITTYWVPSKSAMLGMMKLACFEIVASRVLLNPPRLTILGRAVPPGDINGRSDFLKKVHDHELEDLDLRISELVSNSRLSSLSLSYPEEGIRDKTIENPNNYKVDFPTHPQSIINPLGQL